MKKTALTTLLLACIASPAFAEIKVNSEKTLLSTVNGIIGVTSDYAPRGISLSNEKPAFQSKVVYNDKSGVYASLIGITLDWNDDHKPKGEIDVEGGYRHVISGYDISYSAAGYLYPGKDSNLNYDFYEAKVKVTKDMGFAIVSGSVHYSPNYFFHSGTGFYLPVFINIPIKNGFSLITDGAYTNVSNNKNFGVPDYLHWSVGIGYDINNFNISLKYTDTNIDKNKCPDGCDPRGVLTILRFF